MAETRERLDDLAYRLAATQHGVVARRQLLAAGASPGRVDRHVAARRLVPIHRGVYLLGSLRGRFEPERAGEMAAVLACGPGAVVSHRSAGELWSMLRRPGATGRRNRDAGFRASRDAGFRASRDAGFRASRDAGFRASRDAGFRASRDAGFPASRDAGFRASRDAGRRASRDAAARAGRGPGSRAVIDVTIPGPRRRARPGIRVHRSADLPSAEVTVLEGIPITAPGRTLRDLSTVLAVRELNRAAARAERKGLIDPQSYRELADRQRFRPGAPVLRRALLGGGGPVLTRSEAEERFLALVGEAGLPRPRANALVEGYEVDFFWPGERLVVEVDGFAFHSSRDRFESDRRRDGALESRGIRVIRVTWHQIVGERVATAARVAGAVAHAAREAGEPSPGSRPPVAVPR